MATVSAFGFGGTDHLNTLFEGFTNEWFARRAAQDSLDNQKSYDLWTARSLYPAQLSSQLENYGLERTLSGLRTADNIKNIRAGLEQAGYNPLLAVDSIGSGGGSGPILQMPSGKVNPTSAAQVKFGDTNIQPLSIATARQELENLQKQGSLIDAQTKQTLSTTAETEARTGKILEETATERWKDPLKLFGRVFEVAGKEDDKIGTTWENTKAFPGRVKDLASRMVDYFRSTNGQTNSARSFNRQAHEFYPHTNRSTMFFLNK